MKMRVHLLCNLPLRTATASKKNSSLVNRKYLRFDLCMRVEVHYTHGFKWDRILAPCNWDCIETKWPCCCNAACLHIQLVSLSFPIVYNIPLRYSARCQCSEPCNHLNHHTYRAEAWNSDGIRQAIPHPKPQHEIVVVFTLPFDDRIDNKIKPLGSNQVHASQQIEYLLRSDWGGWCSIRHFSHSRAPWVVPCFRSLRCHLHASI